MTAISGAAVCRLSGMRLERDDMNLALDASGISRTFDQTSGKFGPRRHIVAVDDVTLAVAPGATLGIVGESGCGKSTLARILLGILPTSSGRVLVDGHDLARLDRRARARLIQPVFQDPTSSLNPRQRVADIVETPLRASGEMSREIRRRRMMEMLDRVGLSAEIASRFPRQLSGGQRQRVAIARALVLEPKILICDEPTSALDVSVQAQILNLLVEVSTALGLTLVLISHNLAAVEHIADDVAVMYLGRVVEIGPAADVFRNPRHPYTRALLASVLTPEPGLGLPDVPLDEGYPDPANIPPGCRFHPRCPKAVPICREEAPERGKVECHFPVDDTASRPQQQEDVS